MLRKARPFHKRQKMLSLGIFPIFLLFSAAHERQRLLSLGSVCVSVCVCMCVCKCVCTCAPAAHKRQKLLNFSFAWGEGDSGGHVLRETTSRGLCGLVCPSRICERRVKGDCVKEGGGGEGERERERALGVRLRHSPEY